MSNILKIIKEEMDDFNLQWLESENPVYSIDRNQNYVIDVSKIIIDRVNKIDEIVGWLYSHGYNVETTFPYNVVGYLFIEPSHDDIDDGEHWLDWGANDMIDPTFGGRSQYISYENMVEIMENNLIN
jgi:hypothetical protein